MTETPTMYSGAHGGGKSEAARVAALEQRHPKRPDETDEQWHERLKMRALALIKKQTGLLAPPGMPKGQRFLNRAERRARDKRARKKGHQ